MATYDTVEAVTGTGVSSLTTASFTITSSSNRVAVANVNHTQTGITLNSVSGAGGSFTSCGTRVTSGARVAQQYYRIAPDSGSTTVTATWSDSWGSKQCLAVVTAYDADQTTGVSDYTTASGSSTTPSVTVPNAASGDLVVDVVHGTDGGTATAGADQTERYDYMSTATLACGSTQAGADGGVMSWTMAFGADWAQCGVRILANGGGSTAVPVFFHNLQIQGIA